LIYDIKFISKFSLLKKQLHFVYFPVKHLSINNNLILQKKEDKGLRIEDSGLRFNDQLF
jgi:hypothetical protein